MVYAAPSQASTIPLAIQCHMPLPYLYHTIRYFLNTVKQEHTSPAATESRTLAAKATERVYQIKITLVHTNVTAFTTCT